MKRLFTFAIVGMIASLAFAQSKVARQHQFQQAPSITVLNSAKEAKAAQLEKANAEQTTSTSVFRHKSATATNNLPCVKGTPMGLSFSLRNLMDGTTNIMHAAPLKVETQEGNVTVTTDVNGIITDVTGVEPKYYDRANTGTTYFIQSNQLYYAYQSGTVTVVEDGDNIWIKNPLTRYQSGAWVKGTKSGNTITVAAGQHLQYVANYNATLSLRWGSIGDSFAAADDYSDVITFTVDDNSFILEGTSSPLTSDEGYVIGLYWDDDDSYQGYWDAETILNLNDDYEAPSTELVELPAGAVIQDWYFNGFDKGENSKIKNEEVSVAFVGNDVYVQGMFADYPTSWIKGTIEGSTVTFSKFQFLGNYDTYDIWMVGYNVAAGTLIDAVATYDTAAKTITFSTPVIANAAADRLYYLQYIEDPELSADAKEFDEPIITDLTATLPYVNTFDTDAEIAEVAIYDANDDACTFSFVTDNGSMVARYKYSGSNPGDDYLVFPGLPLEAGTSYKVSVDARANSGTFPERLEVVCGPVAKASALNTTVIPATDLTDGDYHTLTNADFTVAESGTYFFAIHAISDADEFYLYVDNFSVKANDTNSPAAIDDLAVEADATGANKATVTFTVPAKNIAGEAITNALDVTVKCDGEVIYNESKNPGSIVTIESEVETPGYYTYTASTANGAAVSDPASVKAWVGVDIPNEVENLTAADKSTAVALAWDAPTTGENGGVVIVDELTYNVYPVEIIEFWGMLFPETDYEHPYFTGLTETNANVPYNTNEGEQGWTYFAVAAENAAGLGTDIYAAVLTGAPYEMPVRESGSIALFWGVSMDPNMDGDSGLYVGDLASDDDETSILFNAETAGWMTLQSGKIAVAGAANPVVTFDACAMGGSSIEVIVVTPNGETTVKTITPGSTYESYNVSLLPFAEEDWVRVFFKATFEDADQVYIDNIKIFNQLDNNLVAAGIAAPAKVQAGDDINVTVTIENQGANAVAAGKYSIDLYINGTKDETIAGPAVAADAKATASFAVPTSVTSPAEMSFYAVIVYTLDEDNSNNTTATKTTKVAIPNYPTVTGLEAEVGTDGVTLTWNEPDTEAGAPEAVTEDFEDAESFAQEYGDWTFIDNDGLAAGGIQGVDIPGVVAGSSPLAWFVMDCELLSNEAAQAHSGTKYMATMFNYEGGANDDWMISPALYGGEQTISFFAKSYVDTYGLEKIEVLYTTGDKTDLSGYVSLLTDEVPAAWTEYSANLPEGAKYFAIRYISQDVFSMFVDDITFTPAGVAADLQIVGYNIYRNGVKINDEPVADTEYTDAEGTAEDKYSVSVVYTVGESAPCEEVGNTTGIESAINGAAVKVQGHNIIVKAEGNVAIYTVEGKALYTAAGNANVAVAPGVYVVKYGNKTAKVVVK